MRQLLILSPRARNRFNQVVEAKRFEGVFLCRKVYLIKKRNSLKNRLVHKSAMRNGIPPGMHCLKMALKWGYHCSFII